MQDKGCMLGEKNSLKGNLRKVILIHKCDLNINPSDCEYYLSHKLAALPDTQTTRLNYLGSVSEN